jgi:hypothetical protein
VIVILRLSRLEVGEKSTVELPSVALHPQ